MYSAAKTRFKKMAKLHTAGTAFLVPLVPLPVAAPFLHKKGKIMRTNVSPFFFRDVRSGHTPGFHFSVFSLVRLSVVKPSS